MSWGRGGKDGTPAGRFSFPGRTRRLRQDPVNVSRRGIAPRQRGGVRLALPVLMLAAVALLLLSRIDHSATRVLRLAISDALEPVLSTAAGAREAIAGLSSRVQGLARADAELARLRRENDELKAWRARADDLQTRVNELSEASHAPRETEWPFLSARVIADGTGGFVRSVLVNAGREHSLRVGYPVVNRDGLVGRVVGIGRRSANVLLVSDVTSRIPVLVGRNKVRAVLAGENGAAPRLTFVTGGDVSGGDEVVTSGTGGVFPRGLKVGRVVATGREPRVQLNVRLDEVEEVSVLVYDTAAAELVEETETGRIKEAQRHKALSGSAPEEVRR
jgi:rod shape-determining protein MreC